MNDRLEITAVDVRDFKRISLVHIEPGAHKHLLFVAGKNTNGKTSLMDALSLAIGGNSELPPDPIRHGADKSEILIELNDGVYRIKRTIKEKGGKATSDLEIRGPDGKINSPQTWLNNIVSGRFLDPIKFLTEDSHEQRRILLKMIGVDVASIDAERRAVFDLRTEVGRQLKAAQGQRSRIEEPTPAPADARPVSVVHAELEKVEVERRQGEDARAAHTRVLGGITAIDQMIDRNLADLTRLRAEVARVEAELAANQERRTRGEQAAEEAARHVPPPEQVEALRQRREALTAEAHQSEHVARWQATVAATRRQIANADDAIRDHSVAYEKYTAELAGYDAKKNAMLAAAKMPVDGLEVTDDGLALGGVPFVQASQAERLRCALAIAMRQSPRFRDVWVRDGSLLDDDSLEILRALAEELDCRVWVERVGERDPGAIIIRDGKNA